MKHVVQGVTIALILSGAADAQAQLPVRPPNPAPPPVQTRQQIAALESALENAVRHGTQMLNERLQSSNTDNLVMLAGLTRARGFRLDDYGVVFDVEFPSMRRSMVWTMEALSAGKAVRASDVTQAVRPREIYQTEIANALVNAILDYKGSVVAAHEWLTVAARESVLDRRIVPGDPNDTAITVILRLRGSDLQAIRDGLLTREEGLKRVDVKHY